MHPRHNRGGKRGCSITLLFIGIVTIIGGGFLILQNLGLEMSGVVTMAEIVDLKPTGTTHNRKDTANAEKRNYYLVVEFQTEEGDTISNTLDHISFKLSEYEIGDSISVIYNKRKPQIAELNSLENLLEFPIGLLIIGSVLFILGRKLFARGM
jgi:hypothetical protein